MGSAAGGSSFCRCSVSTASARCARAFSPAVAARARSAVPPPSARKGSAGSPGAIPNSPSTPAVIQSARGCAPSCVARVGPIRVPPPALVTMIPEAVLTMSAGICDTRPSPTVRMVYCESAWLIGIPRCTTPMKKPPTRLMAVMRSPATASPFTNFPEPSMAP